MSGVDEELARAVEASEASAAAEPSAEAEPADRPPPRRSVGLLIGLLVACGAILTLVFTSFKGAMIYEANVDDLLRDPKKYESRNVNLQGMLVKGSLMRREQPCEYRFKVQTAQGAVLPVRYASCIIPDTFRDMPGMDVEVTAQGKLAQAGHFEANHILAKCPSKYEMNERAKNGEKAPHLGTMPAAVEPVSANK